LGEGGERLARKHLEGGGGEGTLAQNAGRTSGRKNEVFLGRRKRRLESEGGKRASHKEENAKNPRGKTQDYRLRSPNINRRRGKR